MRRLAIVILGFSLSAASAHAETATWGGTPRNTIHIPAQKWGPLPGSEPYRPHTTPAAPIGSTNGGEGFKPYTPFKGGSVYPHADPARPKPRPY
jgi:hypothetical protein